MADVKKSTVAGMLDIAAGVLALVGGFIFLLLGLVGGSVLSATIPEHLQGLAALPLALFVPLADNPKRIDEGVKSIPFAAGAGKFYRLRWASRPDASISGDPKDMELRLVAAGDRPALVAANGE